MGTSKKKPAVRIPMDYSRLSGKVVEKFGSRATFAREIGFSEASVSKWFNNQHYWPHEAMIAACDALEISDTEVGSYFFTKRIQES